MNALENAFLSGFAPSWYSVEAPNAFSTDLTEALSGQFDYWYAEFEANMANAELFANTGGVGMTNYVSAAELALDNAELVMRLPAIQPIANSVAGAAEGLSALGAESTVPAAAATVEATSVELGLAETSTLSEMAAVAPVIAGALLAVAGIGWLVYELVKQEDVGVQVSEKTVPLPFGPYAVAHPTFGSEERFVPEDFPWFGSFSIENTLSKYKNGHGMPSS